MYLLNILAVTGGTITTIQIIHTMIFTMEIIREITSISQPLQRQITTKVEIGIGRSATIITEVFLRHKIVTHLPAREIEMGDIAEVRIL